MIRIPTNSACSEILSREAACASEPVSFWREVARRGVMALGYSAFDHGRGVAAELISPLDGWLRRAAHAAIEVHKLVLAEPGTPAFIARQALGARLGLGPAIAELAAYQAALLDRLWREIESAPAERLEALAYPHED